MATTIYQFGEGITEWKTLGSETDAINALGAKAAKQAICGGEGYPVPFGVATTTEVCNAYLENENVNFIDVHFYIDEILKQFSGQVDKLGYMPLVSARSTARASMPGMMDSILNIGLHDGNLDEWSDRIGFSEAHINYLDLILSYSEIVVGIPAECFDGDHVDFEEALSIFFKLTGEHFPQTIETQLEGAITAVWNSWNSPRAKAYRRMHGFDDSWGTGCMIQTMVFGNNGATGVMFTRDFNTGEKNIIVDWLPNAQGEKVVNGTSDPKNFDELVACDFALSGEVFSLGKKLEERFNDMQDVEWTYDGEQLWLLQTRDGKRSARAAFKIAYDMVADGWISQSHALTRVTAKQYIALSAPTIDPSYTVAPDLVGTPASGHISSGVAVLSAEAAVKCKKPCVLVAEHTLPKDFVGIAAAVAVLTSKGGITCHAAVVGRGLDKTCVVGASDLKFEGLEGKLITVNGESGEVWIDKDVPVIPGEIPAFVEEMLSWASIQPPEGILYLATPERLSKGHNVYLDVSGALGTTKSLTEALLKAKGSCGVIGFGGNTEVTDPDDVEFLSFFGQQQYTDNGGLSGIIRKVLTTKKWTNTFKKAWALHLPNNTAVHIVDVLRSHGWTVVTHLNSVRSIVTMTKGYFTADASFLAGTLAKDKLSLEGIEHYNCQKGFPTTRLPPRVARNRLLFDVLGG